MTQYNTPPSHIMKGAASNRKEIGMLPPPEPENEAMDQFESYRPMMFSIAYRMLGSVTEAEDILQNAYNQYNTEREQKHGKNK